MVHNELKYFSSFPYKSKIKKVTKKRTVIYPHIKIKHDKPREPITTEPQCEECKDYILGGIWINYFGKTYHKECFEKVRL